MSDFNAFLEGLGIIPPRAIIPGKWVRAATVTKPTKKNAAIKLNDDGSGFAIDHSCMLEAEVWRERVIDNAPDSKEREAVRRAASAERLQRLRQQEIQGTMRAVAAYAKAQPLMRAEHPYLAKKRLGMEGARGLKVDEEGWLVIPMWRDERIVSIQRISGDGDKLFAAGAPTKGATFTIWRPNAPVTILCEGWATGAVVFAACPMASVEVCFSAANLVAVASRNQYGTVAVAGDNDPWSMCFRHKKENLLEPLDPEGPRPEWCRCNPGKTAAMQAAKILGCGYAVPQVYGTQFTDWHDVWLSRLEALEKANEDKSWGASPHKLRSEALAPIRAQIMRAAKNIQKNA